LGDADIDRTMVFVPAIMSVGLVFSIISLLRDLFRWSGGRARERRTRMEAGAVLSELLGQPEPAPDDLGILSRPAYLISALALTGGAAYIAIGSTANFLREQGYVRDIGWLLAVSLVLALVLGFLGGVSLAVYRSWPHPPAWTLGPLRTAPLTTNPGRNGRGPSWGLSVGIGAGALFTGVIALMVGSGRSIALDIDRPIADRIVEAQWIDTLRFVDHPFGGTIVSIVFVALIGLTGFRCRVMAWAFPAAFAVAWLTGSAIREIVDRPRPIVGGDLESFPSGHLTQAVFIAGLVPLAVEILFSARRLATALRFVLGAAVVATALLRVHAQTHYPLDAVAGAGIGLTVVLATHWVVAHEAWHRRCPACPWSPHPDPPRWHQGLFHLEPHEARRLGWYGAGGALSAAAGLGLATLFVGLPRDPEGYGFAATISDQVQLGLAGLMAVAGLLALRRRSRATGAVLMALAATGLGLLASIEYRPLLAVALTVALMIPAVVTWLAWQPDETVGSVTALAATTATILAVTALGSQSIFNYYFGPTHPGSGADDLDLGEGDWAWLGGVTDREAIVVVGGLDGGRATTLWYRPDGDDDLPATVDAVADRDGLARFELDGLEPGVRYAYGVDDTDDVAEDLAEGSADAGTDGGWDQDRTAVFRTFEDGPQDLVVALGSCARVGANGAVYDVIVDRDPDLFLALGDLHYANLDSTDPSDHIAMYGRTAGQPGQAALYSSVPTAYVWDDHDYGPNDSDASSPTRPAVGEAYRRAIPNYGVDPDPEAPIAQAFTIGRVRFVVTDGRSQRTEDTMLGPDQVDWLIEELVASSASHGLVVWMNASPWVGPATAGADSWAGYDDERAAISQALADAGVDNLVMVSGDAHMVAIDDGTNTAYHDGPEPGFPLLHAAALDRPGSIKGGPYSEGAVAGSGQFGVMEILDDGGPTIEVRLSGQRWDGEELVSHRFLVEVGRDAPGAAAGDTSRADG
jgi:membrane-associated phospholipid phosphatase